MAITDEKIGANVLQLRRMRTQKDVADEMRQRGWKWSQATVWSVEKGDRPLRLTEAVDLADIFGVEVELFFRWSTDDAFRLQYEELLAARETLREAIADYRANIVRAVVQAVDHELSDDDAAQLNEAVNETPARIFADYTDNVDWALFGTDLATPEARAKSEIFNEWIVAINAAWESDAEAVSTHVWPGGVAGPRMVKVSRTPKGNSDVQHHETT